jgi:hypothetical protein
MTPEELLRRHEPVVRLTQGELFVPSPVEDYLSRCALVDGHGDAATVLAEPGTLTPDALAAHGRGTGTGLCRCGTCSGRSPSADRRRSHGVV